jgi:hypothetical protein
MRQLYFSHAYPHFIGAITIWGTEKTSSQYIDPLVKMQKKIVRLVKNVSPRSHTKPIMKELKILNITNLYILRVCLEMHPFVHLTKKKNRPQHDHHYIPVAQIHEYPTRHSLQRQHFIPHAPSKSKKQKQKYGHALDHFTRCYAETWATLPEGLRIDTSHQRFKRNLKQHLLEQQSM